MGWGGLFHTLWEEGVRKPLRQFRRDARRIWQRWTVFFGPSTPTTTTGPTTTTTSRSPRRAPMAALQPRWHLCTGRSSQPPQQVSPLLIQQEMRKHRLQRWMIEVLFFAPMLTLVSAGLILLLWRKPAELSPSAISLQIITGLGGMGLWYAFLAWVRHRARRMAAWYQQDIFDLKERGTPLQRHLQRHILPQEDGQPILKDEENAIPPMDDERPVISPLQVAEIFLETHLFGPPHGRIRPIALKRSHGLNLQDPTVQIALWLGGPCWWYLDAYSAVVLENPQGYFRILQGPTFPQKAMDHLPSEAAVEDLDARIQKFIPKEFYSWGFERLRRTFHLHPYTVTIHDHWLRSRDGIWVKVRQCQVRAMPDFRSPAFLETLCTLVRREAGKDGQTWMDEWLEALEGRSLFQQEIRSAVIGALNTYVRQHTLSQILHATSTVAANNTSMETPQGGKDAPGLQVLRQRIEEALRNRGFRLEEVIVFPKWEVPEHIQQKRKALQRQLRELQRKEREIRETMYHQAAQAWLLNHFQGLIPIARELESGEKDFLPLAQRALRVMWVALREGLDCWEHYREQWYESKVSLDGPQPPFEDEGTFEYSHRELEIFASLIRLHIGRPPLKGT